MPAQLTEAILRRGERLQLLRKIADGVRSHFPCLQELTGQFAGCLPDRLIPHQDTGTGEPGAVKINAVDAAGRERPRLTVIRKSAIERIQPHRDHGLRRSVIFREQRTVAAGDQKRLHPGKAGSGGGTGAESCNSRSST